VIVYVPPARAAPRRPGLDRRGRRRARALSYLEHRLLDADRLERANIASDLRRKVINDAAASLRSLAAAHHRNTSWPVLAVTKASNLTAQQALRMHVVDTIAPNCPTLLRRLDGYRTKDTQRPFTLHLAGAQITTVSPGFSTRFLNTLIDPNLISILFLIGIAGLVFELLHPGVVLPGAVGAVSLAVALLGFSILPPTGPARRSSRSASRSS
jgi:membrane-bound serine protease (ClpP class)